MHLLFVIKPQCVNLICKIIEKNPSANFNLGLLLGLPTAQVAFMSLGCFEVFCVFVFAKFFFRICFVDL